MTSLEYYLSQIYIDLEKEMDRRDCLCQIRGLNFENGNIPDYNNLMIQQVYLLRYTYAYTYEYKLIYEHAIGLLGNPKQIRVVSLGCGAMQDYIGLINVACSNNHSVSYYGVDMTNWSYKPECRDMDKVEYIDGISVKDYFSRKKSLDADIYMFPKSISEMTEYEVASIARSFATKRNVNRRFCICVSLRNADGKREEDINKCNILSKEIMCSGYSVGTQNNNYYIIPGDRGIKSLEHDYTFPNEIIEKMTLLSGKCKRKNTCCQVSQCASCLNRYPILKTTHVCYKILYFEKQMVA